MESLDTEVVAFAPMLASHHPRVIAVGEGSGNLLRVNLLLSEECRLRRNIPLLKQVRDHVCTNVYFFYLLTINKNFDGKIWRINQVICKISLLFGVVSRL